MGLRTALENTESAVWYDDHIRIKPITTQADLIYTVFDCQLTKEQEELVNPAGFSIGRGYLFRKDNYPCLILKENREPLDKEGLLKQLGFDLAFTESILEDEGMHVFEWWGEKYRPLEELIAEMDDVKRNQN